MKAVVAAFNQEKALVGAFSVIVQPVLEPMEHYTALDLVQGVVVEVDLVVHDGVEGVALLAPHRDGLDVALDDVGEVDLEGGVGAGVLVDDEPPVNVILPAHKWLVRRLVDLKAIF